MALVDTRDLLRHAYANRYAVGAFEVVSLDFLRAILDAAERARSPVILNIVESHSDLYDLESLMAAVTEAARQAQIPVAVHMDHCASAEHVQNAIRLGCNSVMFDAADEDFPGNVRKTQEVRELTLACGVPIEGEVGYVAGNGADEEADAGTASYTSVNEAKAYVERTGVDFLAISVGTVHGRAKGKRRLDFTRLGRINEALDIPLVIHGGTGLSDEQYQKLIAHGVARINYFTGLAEQAVRQFQTNLNQESLDYPTLVADVSASIAKEAQRCMQVWGSAGRAAEVLMQCKPWHSIDQLVVFQPGSGEEPELLDYVLGKSRQALLKIPGIMDVQLGKSLNGQNQMQYCLWMRLASETVAANYKKHPAYLAHADKYARYLDAWTISGNFQMSSATPPPHPGDLLLTERASFQSTVVEFKAN